MLLVPFSQLYTDPLRGVGQTLTIKRTTHAFHEVAVGEYGRGEAGEGSGSGTGAGAGVVAHAAMRREAGRNR
jgi:hypothetical protein